LFFVLNVSASYLITQASEEVWGKTSPNELCWFQCISVTHLKLITLRHLRMGNKEKELVLLIY